MRRRENRERNGEAGIVSRPALVVRTFHRTALDIRGFLVLFACSILALACVSAIVLLYLEGFHAWGFSLDIGLLRWFGGITIGTVAALTLTIFRAIFKS